MGGSRVLDNESKHAILALVEESFRFNPTHFSTKYSFFKQTYFLLICVSYTISERRFRIFLSLKITLVTFDSFPFRLNEFSCSAR